MSINPQRIFTVTNEWEEIYGELQTCKLCDKQFEVGDKVCLIPVKQTDKHIAEAKLIHVDCINPRLKEVKG